MRNRFLRILKTEFSKALPEKRALLFEYKVIVCIDVEAAEANDGDDDEPDTRFFQICRMSARPYKPTLHALEDIRNHDDVDFANAADDEIPLRATGSWSSVRTSLEVFGLQMRLRCEFLKVLMHYRPIPVMKLGIVLAGPLSNSQEHDLWPIPRRGRGPGKGAGRGRGRGARHGDEAAHARGGARGRGGRRGRGRARGRVPGDAMPIPLEDEPPNDDADTAGSATPSDGDSDPLESHGESVEESDDGDDGGGCGGGASPPPGWKPRRCLP